MSQHSQLVCGAPSSDSASPGGVPFGAADLKVAGTLAIAAIMLRWGIDPFIGDKHQFVPAYAALAAATWLRGWRCGLFVAIACLVTGEMFPPVSPVDQVPSHVAVAYMGYLAMTSLIVSVAEWLRRERLEAILAELRLRDAHQRKSEFMALLGHELRNPLAAIALGGKLLKAGSLDPATARNTLEMLERQAGHMTKLVSDLMDIARLETGKLSLNREVVDVFQVVRDAVDDVRGATSARHQKIVLLQSAPAGTMRADPLRLRQILINLLQNASKFSPPDSAIEVVLKGNDHAVTVSVRDQGVGIDPSQLEAIFDPFVQLGGEPVADRSLGLGLPLTRQLARMHGGNVRARSAGRGKGAEFLVVLPRVLPGEAPAEAQAAPPSGQAEPLAAAAAGTKAATRVLVVDDNEDSAATLALLLQLHGHDASTAHDGHGALQAVFRQPPDVVFLDIGLPGMSGLEVARRIRELDIEQPVLVALTGWTSQEDRRRALAAGFDLHLAKPVSPELIEEALTLVRRPRGAAPP